ncbi:hypothetical protein DMN91_005619 [Ooceraea biroi]|uniref:Uncharacterized protein n=1 Tax=Ooceraea biroi TaxID=2015173 RepID=A0A3L8DLP4_OOCBI|nr:hypothetical protein DMN91_005619 [Ooceraea biroi]
MSGEFNEQDLSKSSFLFPNSCGILMIDAIRIDTRTNTADQAEAKKTCVNAFEVNGSLSKIIIVNQSRTFSRGSLDRHDRCPVEQDGFPSDYGVEMYPGRSVWAVLALGAGILLLSGLQWKIESVIRSEDDGPSVFERSVTKGGVNSPSIDVIEIFLESRLIEGDRRWKRSVRSDRRDGGSLIEERSPATWTVIYAGRRPSSSIGAANQELDGDEALKRIFRASKDDSALGGYSWQDQLPMITQIDARSNGPAIETWISEESKQRKLAEREGPVRPKKNDARETIDTSLTLRNDRSEEDIIEEIGTGSSSGLAADQERRVSGINGVSRGARVSGSQEASINADKDLHSSVPHHTQDSEDDDHRDVPGGTPATSASNDDGEAEERSRSSPGDRASNLELSFKERKIAEGGARRYAAGMQEDQLLFFRDDRERVQSSAMSPAEAISDRKDLPGERDREDPARGRRRASRDWFTRASNRSQNFRGRVGGIATHGTDDNGARHERISEGSVKVMVSDTETKGSTVNRDEQDHRSDDQYSRTNTRRKTRMNLPIDEEDRLRNAPSKDPNSNVHYELPDQIETGEESSDNANAFQIFDSVILPDNKRRKVTRGEDSKELMVASNFVWTSQDQGTSSKILIPEDFRNRAVFLQDRPRRGSRNGFSKKRTHSIVRRDRRQEAGQRIDEDGSTSAVRKASRRETAIGDRRKRYADYYSAQSVTPMAYVHIQPSYPVAPPMNRKCVRCMVVYKPCPSQPRPPPRIMLPSYRYNDPATKWRGLKYGDLAWLSDNRVADLTVAGSRLSLELAGAEYFLLSQLLPLRVDQTARPPTSDQKRNPKSTDVAH